MTRREIIARIKGHQPTLSALGVAHLSIFGSVARDAHRPGSDVDVIVDSATGEAFGLIQLAAICRELEHLLDRKIEVFSQRGLNHAPRMRERIAVDLVSVF